MHPTTDPPGHHAPATDAEIDAAVGAFMVDLTGTHRPVGPAARRYARAMETIAEQVTELLAPLAEHHWSARTSPGCTCAPTRGGRTAPGR